MSAIDPGNAPTPRRALSIRATIVTIVTVTFGFILFAGVAISLRIVPSAANIAQRGAAASADYLARTRLAAQLDSSITDLWRLLRQARVTRLPIDSITPHRQRLERIAHGTSEIAPLRRDLDISPAFGTGLELADAATLRVTASLLGAASALEIADVPSAELLMSRADSLDAPLTERLNEVTQIALKELAANEQALERDARFAAKLLLGWLMVSLLGGPLLWRLLQRRIMQPLATFDAALHRVESGDLSVEIPIPYDDELGRLGAHFNRTTQVLRAQRTEGERAAAQAALEASEARYRAAFEEAAVGLAEIGLDGTLIRINRTLSVIFGREAEAIIGHRFLEFAHPDDIPLIKDGWPQVLRGDSSAGRVVRRYLRGDGSVAITQVTATLVRHPDGSPRHVLAVVHDITEQRRLEREILQTTKLEAVGQLAGGVAHDFNNLLAGIIGYAELLEANSANSRDVRDDASSIRRAALKGADLARSLLTLARRNTRREEPFTLDAVLHETIDLARRTFDRRVDVQLAIEGTATIRGDRSMLANALLNLVVNARDAMPDGGTLRVVSRITHPDAAFRSRYELPVDVPIATIDVIDTGVGMPPEVLQRIFEPYFTTKSPDKGTGLGLPMVYGTVKDHRGAITIESSTGHGTCVTLYLPCAINVDGIAETKAATPTAVRHARILIVDDEPLVRTVAERALRRLGYEVESVEDGQLAVERLADDDHGIDLVIVDGNMPRLNGIETARRLHARHPALPMIFASGHFDPAQREDLAHLGFRDRIDKPYTLETLAASVARCLASATPD